MCSESKNNTRDGRIWTNLIYSESSGSWERPRKKKFQKNSKKGEIIKKNASRVKKTTRGRTDPAAPGLSASLYL